MIIITSLTHIVSLSCFSLEVIVKVLVNLMSFKKIISMFNQHAKTTKQTQSNYQEE